jgi:hypothetical protein
MYNISQYLCRGCFALLVLFVGSTLVRAFGGGVSYNLFCCPLFSHLVEEVAILLPFFPEFFLDVYEP